MISRITTGVMIALLAAIPASAQVVREDGQKSIAGVIGGSHASSASWTFRSPGGEVLFASLDAEIYRKTEHHEEGLVVAAEEGGCGEETTARFCLQVIDASQAVICEVSRPAPPPGWQIDPRMACLIPGRAGEATYAVRVSASGPDGACSPPTLSVPIPDARPFLLNLSLRRAAPSGTSIQQAVAQSRNRF